MHAAEDFEHVPMAGEVKAVRWNPPHAATGVYNRQRQLSTSITNKETVMNVRRPRGIAVAASLAALLVAASPSAFAYFENYLSGSIIGTLTQKEAASLQKSVRTALVDTEDNKAVEWHYPAENRRQAVDGTISPVETRTDKGQTCRRLKSELKRGSATEAWSGWFCKQSNGTWKARHVGE